jgi:hypothetical protein
MKSYITNTTLFYKGVTAFFINFDGNMGTPAVMVFTILGILGGTRIIETHLRTASGDGKIPFVSARDIAAVAFRALTDEKPHNTSYGALGPELLTYDEVCRLFGSKSHVDANAESLHADCGKTEQRSGTGNRAHQTLRRTKGSTIPELGPAGTLCKDAFLP